MLNLLIVWGLTGIWHGASWNFVLWGLYYGVLLIFEKFVFKKVLDKLPSAIQHIYTMFIVVIGWGHSSEICLTSATVSAESRL